MIKIVVYKSREGIIDGFKVTGHSGYSTEGSDIVCSAVSALTQTALLGLLKVAKADVDYEIDEGYLCCKVRKTGSRAVSAMCYAILETMYEGILNIRESYAEYIDIVEEEVQSCSR